MFFRSIRAHYLAMLQLVPDKSVKHFLKSFYLLTTNTTWEETAAYLTSYFPWFVFNERIFPSFSNEIRPTAAMFHMFPESYCGKVIRITCHFTHFEKSSFTLCWFKKNFCSHMYQLFTVVTLKSFFEKVFDFFQIWWQTVMLNYSFAT